MEFKTFLSMNAPDKKSTVLSKVVGVMQVQLYIKFILYLQNYP